MTSDGYDGSGENGSRKPPRRLDFLRITLEMFPLSITHRGLTANRDPHTEIEKANGCKW